MKLLIRFTLGMLCLDLLQTDIQAGQGPAIVAKGFAEYIEHGADAAWRRWTEGSNLSSDDRRKQEYLTASATAAAKLGKPLGYEEVDVKQIAESVMRVSCVWKFERGPLYVQFTCYKIDTSWIITSIRCSEVLDDIVPLLDAHPR